MIFLASLAVLIVAANVEPSRSWYGDNSLSFVAAYFVASTAVRLYVRHRRMRPLIARYNVVLAELGRQPTVWDRARNFFFPSFAKSFVASFGDAYADNSSDLFGWVFGKAMSLFGEHVMSDEGRNATLIRESDELRQRIDTERTLFRWFLFANLVTGVVALVIR